MDTEQEVDVDRLRRELRAMAAVNRQLQAQLDGTGGRAIAVGGAAISAAGGDLLAPTGTQRGAGGGPTPRRAPQAVGWMAELELTANAGAPQLVRGPTGSIYVIEANRRREVKSGLLAAALDEALGGYREVDERELDQWSDGVPVEVFEGPHGPAFVVVGGRRLAVRGLPLPHPVSAEQMQLFPEGDVLNVAAANVARQRFDHAVSGRYQVERAREAIAREGGPVRAGAALGRRAAGKVRRALKR
jgi:hypothetical protein